MKMLLYILMLSLSLCAGCTSPAVLAVQKAQKEMQSTFDGAMGYSEEEVVMKLGPPQNIQNIGELKVYHYYQSYGMRSNAYASAISSSAIGVGNAWESYDKADVVFKDGRAVSWKGYVQR
jgi:hypothetical protein